MTVRVGDRLTILGRYVHSPIRQGEIVEVLGDDGPPFRVRWDDTGRETQLWPGSDARIEHPRPARAGGVSVLGQLARAADGSSTLTAEQAVELRRHADLERIRSSDSDTELFDLWLEEMHGALPWARNAEVLDRVLARVRTGD